MSAFDKIIGYESIKTEMIRICDTMKNPEKYERLGVTSPRGVLFWGNPGVGKSLFAQCMIEEIGRRSYVIRKEKPDGAFIDHIRETFEEAKENEPSIVLLDDMDKFANGDNDHPDAEEYVTVQACIDGCKGKQVMIIATANNKCCLPDSLLRTGRFDKVIEFEMPTGKDARRIIEHYLSQKKVSDDIDIVEISRLMDGGSCAELEAVVNEAGILAGYNNSEHIKHEDLRNACIRSKFNGPEEYDVDVVDEHVAYHEAGHATVSEVLYPGSVNMATVCCYYGDKFGTVDYSYEEPITRKSVIERKIMSSLGGKAALEVVFGVQDIGCGSDIYSSYWKVKELVDDLCYMGFDSYITHDSSQYKLENRDRLVTAEFNRYYGETKRILIEHRSLLDAIKQELVEKKTLTFRDIERIRNKVEST